MRAGVNPMRAMPGSGSFALARRGADVYADTGAATAAARKPPDILP